MDVTPDQHRQPQRPDWLAWILVAVVVVLGVAIFGLWGRGIFF